MNFSPSHATPSVPGSIPLPASVRVNSGSSPRAGTLARPNPDRTGHFSFQPLHNISGGISDPHKAGFFTLHPAAWRTRPEPNSPAKPGAFPLIQIDHFTHSKAPLFSHSKVSNGVFLNDGKAIHDEGKDVHG